MVIQAPPVLLDGPDLLEKLGRAAWPVPLDLLGILGIQVPQEILVPLVWLEILGILGILGPQEILGQLVSLGIQGPLVLLEIPVLPVPQEILGPQEILDRPVPLEHKESEETKEPPITSMVKDLLERVNPDPLELVNLHVIIITMKSQGLPS
jgi:hypothetical protein